MGRHAARVVRNDEFWASACSVHDGAPTTAPAPGHGRQRADLIALGKTRICFRRDGVRRACRQGRRLAARTSRQNRLLRRLSRRVRTRISRLLSNPAARGTATRIHQEPIGGIRRASANEQYHVRCCSCAQPGNVGRFDRKLSLPQSKPVTTPAPEDLVAAGKKIYEEGIANSDVPPCAGCHGPDAKGNAQFPRLAGQLSDYIFDKLSQSDQGTRSESSKPGHLDHYRAHRAQLD